MRKIHTYRHPDMMTDQGLSFLERKASRGIVLMEHKILLLHTERYDDYSLPGGGLDDGEDPEAGLIREMTEETGARNIRNIKEFGLFEEFRPWYKPEVDGVHMLSYCYTCDVDPELGPTQLESYEVKNGMSPVWIDIHQALTHNRQTLAKSEKKGLSLFREIFLLEFIIKECLSS